MMTDKVALLLVLATTSVTLGAYGQIPSATISVYGVEEGSPGAIGKDILIKGISTRYDPDFTSFHIFGEVLNNLERPVQNVKLTATFFDSYGNMSGIVTGYTYLNILNPDEKSAFDVVARGGEATRLLNFSYYKLSKTWDEVEEQKPGLLRLDVRNITADMCGYYNLEGIVTNLGKDAAKEVGLSGAFYNAEGQVVGSAFTTIQSIDPTKSAPFLFMIDRKVLPHFAYYSLNVQSREYASTVLTLDDNPTLDYVGPSTLPEEKILMTISTDSITYPAGTTEIRFNGTIAANSAQKIEPNSFAVIKIITPSGSVPYLITAPVSKSGEFTRLLTFQSDEGSQGQVFRVRAEYQGMFAENTFSIGNGDQQAGCNNSNDLRISKLSLLDSYDDNSGGLPANTTDLGDYFARKQIVAGSQVVLSTDIVNKLSSPRLVIVIFEVFDASGVVVDLDIGSWNLDPNSVQQATASWVPPAEGTFMIKSFVLSSLDEPVLLSSGAPAAVSVIDRE